MSDLTATQARTVAYTDLNVHNEIDYITRQIISESLIGNYTVIIDDDTTMTESTPAIVVTGTVANPTITNTNTVILAGVTVILGTTGLSLNAVIADINDAAIAGVTANKNAGNQLVITYEPSTTNWSLVIGAGTANTDLGITDGTVAAIDPESVGYYNTWSGQIDNRKNSFEIAQVLKYFQNAGFNIVQKQNAVASNTFLWELYW